MGTVSSLLSDHIELRLRCVDRIGVAGYVRDLAYEGGLVRFLLHRASLAGGSIPSPALLAQNHDRMTGDFDRVVADSKVPVVRFNHGDSKELMARPYQLAAAAEGRAGVVLVGKTQERMKAWHGHKDGSSSFDTPGHPHFSFTRQSKVPDHWYFYLFDDQMGPGLHQTLLLCALPDVDHGQRTRMDKAPADQARHRVLRARQRPVASGRSRRRPPDLRIARRRPSPSPHRPLAARFAQPVHPR